MEIALFPTPTRRWFSHTMSTLSISMCTHCLAVHTTWIILRYQWKIIFFFHAYILNSISSNWINELELFCAQIMYQMHAHPVNLSCSQFHFCCVLVSVLFKSLSTAMFSAYLSYSFQGISLNHQAGSLMQPLHTHRWRSPLELGSFQSSPYCTDHVD